MSKASFILVVAPDDPLRVFAKNSLFFGRDFTQELRNSKAAKKRKLGTTNLKPDLPWLFD
jgi:hypothetical protein